MKLRYLATVVVLALVPALTTVAAHAQVGLYINPIAYRVSNSTQDPSNFAFLGQNTTARTFWGVNLGGYYDFFHATSNSLTAGIDVRDSDVHANNASLKSFLFGVRVSGKPFARPIRPYVQASVGVGASKAPTSSISVKKVQYGIYGGADYTIQRHVDFRVVEVSYGSVNTISSTSVGGGGGLAIPASKLFSVSTGLVFRFGQ